MNFEKGDKLYLNPLRITMVKRERPWIYKLGHFYSVICENYDPLYELYIVAYRRTQFYPLERYLFSSDTLEKYFVKNPVVINLKEYVSRF